MATITGRIVEARRDLMRRAARRWLERQAVRDDGLAKIAAMGIGAADTPARRTQWSNREALKTVRGLPRFGERVIGTADFVAFAPSVQAASVAAPVARICTLPDRTHAAEGVASGLLLPQGLLLTNYHVFPGQQYAVGYAANFGYARDERGVREGSFFELDPAAFFVEDADFDFVIVAVKPVALSGEPLAAIAGTRLIESTGKVLTGMPMNIVQHPGGGPRQFAVSNNRLVDILPAGYLHYETDTERGSSGSPVYNQDWELIALHHCGVPQMRGNDILKNDGSVWDENHDADDDIHWIANEGTRVSFIVDRLKAMSLTDPAQQARLQALLAATGDPFGPEAAALPQPAATSGGGTTMPGSGNSFAFSGPVTMHVYAPPAASSAPVVPAVAVPAVPAVAVEEKALLFDLDYPSRAGYATDFLGVHIALPGVASERGGELYTVGDYTAYHAEYRDVPTIDTTGMQATDAVVLAYHHYSLVMHKTYRMCMWTASNCDYGDDARRDTRPRSAFGGENWRFDPRVPRELQLADADVYQPAKRIDRGHIVRRDDNCWGAIGLPTEHANADSYHWTNCTPQHEAFNQENPNDRSGLKVYAGGVTGIWGHFEAQVAQQIKNGGGKAVLFAGPVLKDFFQPKDWGNGKVRIPKQFWKVVVVPASLKKKPQLLAYGFLFTQVTVVKKFGLTYESIELPEFASQRRSLKEIAHLTGVVFPPEVLDADQLKQPPGP